ncbi:hypothetical protein QWJ34_04325 [Saccharibacillus sp. CPCC 101409]|uniref:alpha-amylase family protein n=1 Tax=Saccharibacillus sp. CPCC 101409 TaxID=3058041 RepID=UPI002671270A|nr:alpha-amylase family protein [Saccharibacillus sp. CPCC 101409]MDO3408985.1 hypothetical protein [Saccharibacillus sp. CPCC 101409]
MQDKEEVWWRRPLRIIQPNLQVADTDKIDPARLAGQLEKLGANAVVFNVGGIYAWYETEVPHHTRNPFLPAGRDLLAEVIAELHKRDIRFIARYDFSKADDSVWLRRPQWFARDGEGRPETVGAGRPGPWPLLLTTCINGGYRNGEAAEKVLAESLERYDIDGVFFNAPGYAFCRCEICRGKYARLYGGAELPESRARLERDFPLRCMTDNLRRLNARIKSVKPHLPTILYYDLYRDRLEERSQIADLICAEPQDILSLGWRHIPEFWKPALSMRFGRSAEGLPAPLGIVHSCPGMDWRHTGLPAAEYRFWMAQVPANGGQIWHSLTGVPDTIGDKRILEQVAGLNRDAARVAPYMHGAEPEQEIALLWNSERSAEGWAEALIGAQLPFAVLPAEAAEAGGMERYRAVIAPEGLVWTAALRAAAGKFVRQGGGLLAEGALPGEPASGGGPAALLGLKDAGVRSEELQAAYIRFEPEADGHPLRAGLERTELLPLRGRVSYCFAAEPGEDTQILATLVPPFSPPEAVGAPPERASLPAPRTDLPMAVTTACGRGRTLYFAFSLSALIAEYKLDDHYRLAANAVRWLLGAPPRVEASPRPGLQLTVFRRGGERLAHLVNGAGRRPLTAVTEMRDVELAVRTEKDPAGYKAECLISGETPETEVRGDALIVRLPVLRSWECVRVSPAESGPNL